MECFVYITLPNETEFVTAGRFELTKDRNGVATGRFVYGQSYLARDNAIPLDPIELKLRKGTYQTTILTRCVWRNKGRESGLLGPPGHRKAHRKNKAW